jgi:hypothetical protein
VLELLYQVQDAAALVVRYVHQRLLPQDVLGKDSGASLTAVPFQVAATDKLLMRRCTHVRGRLLQHSPSCGAEPAQKDRIKLMRVGPVLWSAEMRARRSHLDIGDK